MSDRDHLTTTKTCSLCGETKRVERFYNHSGRKDGKSARCKTCNDADVKARKDRDPGKVAAEKARWYLRNRSSEQRKRTDRYLKDHSSGDSYRADHLEEHAARARRHKALYPDKDSARNAVRAAVRSGDLAVGPCCECGRRPAPEGRRDVEAHHHKGYDAEHALDVVWLCTKCHGRERRSS